MSEQANYVRRPLLPRKYAHLAQDSLEAQAVLDETAENLLRTFPFRVRKGEIMNPGPDVADRVAKEDDELLAALKAEAEEAKTRVTPFFTWFEFRPIGWKAWREFLKKYPPEVRGDNVILSGGEAHLLRDSCVNPKLTLAQAEELLESDEYSAGQIDLLLSGAIEAQQ